MDSQGRELLDQVYSAFSERSNDLLDAVAQPGALSDKDGSASRWTDLGDWLSLAEAARSAKSALRSWRPCRRVQ